GRERIDAIAPAAVGGGGTDLFGERRARGFNGHARQHCAGRVLDLTRESSLRRCDARDDRDESEQQETSDNCTHGDLFAVGGLFVVPGQRRDISAAVTTTVKGSG